MFITDKGKPVVRLGRKAMGQGEGQEGARRRGRQVAEGMDGTLPSMRTRVVVRMHGPRVVAFLDPKNASKSYDAIRRTVNHGMGDRIGP